MGVYIVDSLLVTMLSIAATCTYVRLFRYFYRLLDSMKECQMSVLADFSYELLGMEFGKLKSFPLASSDPTLLCLCVCAKKEFLAVISFLSPPPHLTPLFFFSGLKISAVFVGITLLFKMIHYRSSSLIKDFPAMIILPPSLNK